MKNYLGNLLARHMSQADVLLPRLVSRFEPQSSVLESDGFQVETAELDVAESFGVESDVVAPVSEPVSVAPVSAGLVSERVLDVSVPDFVAPASPIPSGIERRLANPSPPSSRLPESVVESSGSASALAELTTTPTIAVSDDFESPILSGITSAVVSDWHDKSTVSEATSNDRVPSVSRFASTSRVQSDDDSESRSEAPADFTPPLADKVAIAPGWTNTTDQVAALDRVAERAPTESGPTTQPYTANELLTAIEPIIANEHVTEIERVTPSVATAQSNSNLPLTQRHVETQPAAVSKLTTETTETGRETVALATKSEPFATSIKSEPFATTTSHEPFATATDHETFTSGVSHSEGDRSVGPPKLQPTTHQQPNSPTTIEHSSIEHSSRELLSAVVVPERTEISPVVNAERESQISAKPPESFPEEVRPPRRARQLETSMAKSPVNIPGNVNAPGNTRLPLHNDIGSTEPGPTINVTIGRIEVRAATSEARPQKQRREQVLSLDDYLNQRSAGGR